MHTPLEYIQAKVTVTTQVSCGQFPHKYYYNTISEHWFSICFTKYSTNGFDDSIYCHFFTITVNYNSSHIQFLNDVCLSMKNLSLISSPLECTAFYHCHAAGIEVTMSDNSSIFTLFSDLVPVNDSFAVTGTSLC